MKRSKIAELFGQMWKNLDKEQREPYEAKAKITR
jgi:hypothetical protein